MDRAVLEFVALLRYRKPSYGDGLFMVLIHPDPGYPPASKVALRQNRDRKPITLVMSELWAKSLSNEYTEGIADVANLVLTKQVGEGRTGKRGDAQSGV